MAKRKGTKETQGKPRKRGLPWVGWLGIGLGTVAIIVLVCVSPTKQTTSLSDSGELDAAVIDQLYAFDQPNQEFIEQVTGSLESYGFEVDLYQGDEVTVDFYRNLPRHGYELIIFRAHSGLIKAKGEEAIKTSLFTAEGYSQTKYWGEQLKEELVKARVSEGYPFYFAIDSNFIARRMEGRFDDSVIVITGCSCLAFEDLAQAFIDKGASAYLAWDHTVNLNYVDDATIALIGNLCAERLTIEEAVARTMEEKGADPDWGAVLKYYPPQSGGKSVNELIRR